MSVSTEVYLTEGFFVPVDVMDVAWSPHDAWLASCSVDNTVVIWNAVKFPGTISLMTKL